MLRLILSQALRRLAIGGALGLAGAWLSTRALTTMLYGVQPTDPLTFAAVPAILAITALAASYLPARRASRVDPMVAHARRRLRRWSAHVRLIAGLTSIDVTLISVIGGHTWA